MADLDPSAVSVATLHFRSFLAENIAGLGQVAIDHPKNALATIDPSKQNLNLFVHRLAFSGYPADGSRDDPLYVSLHCLITAMGTEERSGRSVVTAGGVHWGEGVLCESRRPANHGAVVGRERQEGGHQTPQDERGLLLRGLA